MTISNRIGLLFFLCKTLILFLKETLFLHDVYLGHTSRFGFFYSCSFRVVGVVRGSISLFL